MNISPQDKQALLTLARDAVAYAVGAGEKPAAGAPAGLLAEPHGCFVTLTNDGQLRGCIGTFSPRGPLAEMIIEMGVAAAKDPRFTAAPVTAAELPHLTVEVSVLSELIKTDDPLSLDLGRHGIYITRGFQSGCFLPEVATDTGWDVKTFLRQCCAGKAGLAPDAWAEPGTEVYLFTSEKFSDAGARS